MTVKNSLAILLVAAACAALAASPARADALKITVGQKGLWNADFYEFAQDQGFFKDAGLAVEIVYTDGGSATLRPAITGDVDIACTNGFLGVIAAYVKGAPIRVIASEAKGASEIFWYVKSDSAIKSIKDATGKSIGFSTPGSSSNLVLLALLAQEKVKANPLPTGNGPATLTQAMTGQVDIGWAAAPLALTEVAAGTLRIIARGSDVTSMRNETVRVNVANLNALTAKRDAITRFVEADAKAIAWAYQDPRAIDYFAEHIGITRALAEKTVKEFYPQEAYRLDQVSGVANVLTEAFETKRIDTAMTPDQIKGLFDLVLVKGP
jgi:NitT/TauT family transport system substrate-binding protein